LEAGPAPNEVVSVELFPRDNAKAHHTSNYEIVDNANPALVVRRGDPFYLAIRLNGAYDQNRDKIRLEFMFGMSITHFKLK
jgi:transglutaminase 1